MSKIALSGDANGNGTLTIASPNTNSDRTLTLPDSTGTIATAESTLTQFNASGSAPVYACRAWVNFNGTGTVAIRASGNVSSITDVGTGQYTVNLTTAMSDVNYAVVASGAKAISGDDGNNSVAIGGISRVPTTTTVPITNFTESVGQTDNAYIYVAVFR